MKKGFITRLFLLLSLPLSVWAQSEPFGTPQMEKLTRGVVALPGEDGGQFISWRMLGTDPMNTTFDLVRDGKVIALDIKNSTSYTDMLGTDESNYQVVVRVGGEVVETTEAVKPWKQVYNVIQLNRPKDGVDEVTGEPYFYTPNDCSTGDMDGDGEYELVVKWEPSNTINYGSEGKHSGNEFIDCYRLNGEQLWRIDMGKNIQVGSSFTQFLVYDFDGDGCAEVIMKTAPGTLDGKGNYVNLVADDADILAADNLKDWRDSTTALIKGGQEYLTVFKGLTGEAIHTIFYNPNRDGGWGGEPDGTHLNWDDREGREDYVAFYGNRGNRFLVTVAYLDGKDKLPSAVMCRGYYTYSYLWAVDFKDGKLQPKWLHASMSKTEVVRTDANGKQESRTYETNTFNDERGYNTAYGQGNHNLCVADVDGDGCDEIIYGAAAIDHDGWLKYSTGMGHGDAMHLADIIPSRPGYEVLKCLETEPYGLVLFDACTGEKIFHQEAWKDTGRALMGNISADYDGYEFWGATGNSPRETESGNFEMFYETAPSTNFRIYWDGDLLDELFDGNLNTENGISYPSIEKWKDSVFVEIDMTYNGSQTCNWTKATPCLQADLFGDWREELIMWNYNDPSQLNIFTTNIPTDYRVPTLMHDHNYRLAIAFQNTTYNQPPHLGYYLPDADFSYREVADGVEVVEKQEEPFGVYSLTGILMRKDATNIEGLPKGVYIVNKKKVIVR